MPQFTNPGPDNVEIHLSDDVLHVAAGALVEVTDDQAAELAGNPYLVAGAAPEAAPAVTEAAPAPVDAPAADATPEGA